VTTATPDPLDAINVRLEGLWAEVRRLRDFAAAAERGEHDDEQRIAAAAARLAPMPEATTGLRRKKRKEPPAPDPRVQQIRQMQRNSLALQALNQLKQDVYPEIHALNRKVEAFKRHGGAG
jgi:hypothetical protein